MASIRKDITEFKTSKNLDQVIILWTANTERFSRIIPGINDTADNLLKAIDENHSEISPSTVFAVAAALEGVSHVVFTPFIYFYTVYVYFFLSALI